MKKENYIKELVERVFEKAKKESQKDTAYGLCKYLHEEEKVHSSERNLTRYYNYFITGNEDEKIKPDDATLDELSRYLDNNSFNGFIKKLKKREYDINLEGKVQVLKNRLALMTVLLGILSMALLFFVSKYYRKNCMIWVEDHFEKIRCSGLENERRLNIVELQKMRQIIPERCEHELWYDKTEKKITFFTYYGEHPTNGKMLRRVTEYICEKYILERRDSVLVRTSSDIIK